MASASPTADPATAAASSQAPQIPPGASTQKREKKPKPPKAPATPEKPLSPSLIDLRVGHILKAERHPNADSLYVSTIAVGDAAGTPNTQEYTPEDGSSDGKPIIVRTVCSGLNGLIPLEDMQQRRVVCVCNLKPITMRGIKSAAMVLAASPRLKEGELDEHKGPVELVEVPKGSEAGERVAFGGFDDGEPDVVLNPKKKVWENCQVGFLTTQECEVAFDPKAAEAFDEQSKAKGVGLLRTAKGVCTVKSLKGAIVR